MNAVTAALTVLLLLATTPQLFAEAPKPDFERWEKNIHGFETQDKEQPPAKGGILFVGSSSIRKWNVQQSFPGLPVINRGFGGSTYEDVNHFRERLVSPYAPKTVVLYAGDNDAAQGQSPERIFAAFQSFADWLQESCPGTRLIVMSIKPSPARWKLWDTMRDTNRRIKDYTDTHKNCVYIDSGSVLFGKDNLPQRDLYVEDALHLSEAGYQRWTQLLTPHLKNQ